MVMNSWGWSGRVARRAGALALCVLAGCASYSGKTLPLGASQADAIALMGPPTGRYQLPDGKGERLEYAKGPQGDQTFMLDFEPGRGLVRNDQVLDLNHFYAIKPGMTTNEVRTMIGRPSHIQGMAFKRSLWSWRFHSTFCTWWQVTFEPDGTVRDASEGPDPRCERTRFGL